MTRSEGSLAPEAPRGARDRYVDLFKGGLILWIVHLHTVFFSGDDYIPDLVRQVSCLVDVPAFFFVSGYLLKTWGFRDCLLRSVRLCARLFIVYALVSLLLIPLLYLGAPLLGVPAVPVLSTLRAALVLNPFRGLWDLLPAYGGSLWFLRTYLEVLCVVPFVCWFLRPEAPRLRRYALLVLMLMSFHLARYVFYESVPVHADMMVKVAFYTFLFCCGACFRADEARFGRGLLATAFLLSGALCLFAFYHDGGVLSVQSGKFPPSYRYLAYSLPLVVGFMIGKRAWKPPILSSRGLQALEWCGKHVFAVYLAQGIACSVPCLFITNVRDWAPAPVVYGAILCLNLAMALLLARGGVFVARRVGIWE